MAFDTKKKRFGLKTKPLRQAGQSVQDELNSLVDDKVLSYIFAATIFVAFAGWNWFLWFTRKVPHPAILTAIAFGVCSYAAVQVYKLRKDIRNLALGRDGERLVGQFLDTLHSKECFVFHDIVGEGFNIDHVLVSTKGVFVIETKTYSKPGGDKQVRYDGERLLIDGIGDKTSAIDQVTANAKWIAETLKNSTGKDYPIRPVVLFPDWYCAKMPKGVPVWVLEPKGLPGFLEYEKDKLSAAEVHLAKDRLMLRIRGANA